MPDAEKLLLPRAAMMKLVALSAAIDAAERTFSVAAECILIGMGVDMEGKLVEISRDCRHYTLRDREQPEPALPASELEPETPVDVV